MHARCLPPTRLKASLERLQRLTQGYADAMIDIFPGRASALGNALGLEEERVTVSACGPVWCPLRCGLGQRAPLLPMSQYACTKSTV